MDYAQTNEQTGPSLAQSRAAKGYSLEDLATTTGLTVEEIEAVERGDSVPGLHLERIAQALR